MLDASCGRFIIKNVEYKNQLGIIRQRVRHPSWPVGEWLKKMQLALVNNQLVEASPDSKGQCPQCKKEVISKCGEIKIWHWAHLNLLECDLWWEPETIWHRDWKNNFPVNCREVVITRGANKHRADIKIDNFIIELQSKPLSPEEIKERERFYTNAGFKLIWIYKIPKITDIDDFGDYISNLKIYKKDFGFSFKWKYMPRSFAYHDVRSFILDWEHPDYPDTLFQINKFFQNENSPWGGYGVFRSKSEFIKKYNNIVSSRLF